MKNLVIFCLGLVAFSTAIAKPVLVRDEKAYILVCRRNAVGCADRIVVNQKAYMIGKSPSKEVTRLIGAVVGANRFHNIGRSLPFKVEGYAIKEKGHMPNPTVLFDVFVITSMESVMLPK